MPPGGEYGECRHYRSDDGDGGDRSDDGRWNKTPNPPSLLRQRLDPTGEHHVVLHYNDPSSDIEEGVHSCRST